ncbi:oligosaccharide flippase family protein [bacterium]|nr:MAG: oligosaccharide flippase family protein [bacterium]
MKKAFEWALRKLRAIFTKLGSFIFGSYQSEHTDRNRGQDRLNRAAITGSSGIIANGITIGVSLISIPIAVNYLGANQYGVWLTISSLLSWLAISDMGFGGMALVNTLSEARGCDDYRMARELISTSFAGLCAISAILFLMFVLSFPFVPWSSVFNASEFITQRELHQAIVIAFILFVLMFPTSILNAVYLGFQEGYYANGWSIAGSFVSLLAIIMAVVADGGLSLLIVAISGSRLAVFGIALLHLFYVKHPSIRPDFRMVTGKAFYRLFPLGWKYLFQQLAGVVMFQSQPMLITHYLGPAYVSIYIIGQKILSLPLQLVQFYTFPLIPGYGEAKICGDWRWIWSTLRKSSLFSGIFVLATIIPIALLCPIIIEYWVGASLVPSRFFIAFFSCYVFINALVTPTAVFFTGIEWVGSQAIMALLNGGVTIVLAVILLPILGLSGMALSMGIGLLAINGSGQWLLFRFAKRKFVRMQSN